ncbi:hypothetical protein DFH29DRAFT_1074445 [Suillus ampliporus]|nr:hypothetical protein DFH29DRAFT_1074445 [Suillus ampliporus]
MWTQQRTVSIVIISKICVGYFYSGIISFGSLVDVDCPYQTTSPSVLRIISGSQRKEVSIADVMVWTLKTSINSGSFTAALEFLCSMSQNSNENLLPLYKTVRDMFNSCFDAGGKPILEDGALAYGKVLIQCSWHDMVWLRYQADICTALCMVVPAGADGFAGPDEKTCDGKFGPELDLPDVDWLMDSAKQFFGTQDFDAREMPSSLSRAVLKSICLPFSDVIKLLNPTQWPEGSRLASSPPSSIQLLVLRVLPAPKVDTPQRYTDYCRALVLNMDTDQSLQLRRAALRVACGVIQDLPMIAADGELRDIFSELSRALLTVVHPDHIDADHDIYYLRLIYALASSPAAWLRRLDEDGHIRKSIKIIPEFHDRPPSSLFYLTGIFLRIQERDRPDCDVMDDGINILKDLVKVTETHMPQDPPTNELESFREELKFLREGLGDTLKLEPQQSPVDESISAVRGLKDVDESIVLAVRGLKDVIDRRLNPQG